MNRPRLQPTRTVTDTLLEGAALAALLLMWLLAGRHYNSLPDSIPVHFDAAGKPDRYGAKIMLLSLPVVATVLLAGMYWLNQRPHWFNFPVTVTDDNAPRLYGQATRLMRVLMLIIAVVFAYITWQGIRVAQGEAAGLGAGFLPLFIIAMALPLVWIIRASLKG